MGSREGAAMSETRDPARSAVLTAVSNAMVALHKEQFGRGPTGARSHFAGRDGLICVLSDALLPAERALVELGQQQRVRESRLFLQAATADRWIEAVEEIVGRKVYSFSSASDPDRAMIMEMFIFEPPPEGEIGGG
jgi:uncharacterized protein YbcI